MRDKDFRVGDKVTRIMVERGYVCDTQLDNNHPEIRHDYSNVVVDFYTYHGHNVTFDVKGEEPPKRTVKRYVNLYWSEHDQKVVQGAYVHATKSGATDKAFGNALATGVEIEIPEDEVWT